MAELYITSKSLIQTLKITDIELIEIEKFFDSIPDDEWELAEGKDYKVVSSSGNREYTQSGAYTIARYLESTKKQSFWDILKEWILHTKRDIRRSFVRKKILENSSSLIKRNDQFFISKADAVAVYGTRSDYLTKMAEHTQRTKYPLIQGQDYEDFPDIGLHFSVSGIYKLSHAFEERQTKKNRREWCRDVGDIIQPQIKDIVHQIQERDKRIQSVMIKIKKKVKTCQVTNAKGNRINPLPLAVHHLYSRNEYPHLADVESNLIVISCEVHDQFHQDFMGGTHKPCTIADFITFVQQYYPQSTILTFLENQKLALGNPQPIDQRKPHVLYLPASKVS